MPNAIAYLMLSLWPVVCVMLFRKLPLERAIIWSILGGYLFLPPVAEFDLPLVPDMTKVSIPNISAFFICVFAMRKPVPVIPQNWIARILVLIFVFGVIPTVLTNRDPIVLTRLGESLPITFAFMEIPGLRAIDIFSVLSSQAIMLMPLLLARRYLASEEGMRELLYALVVGGMIYSIPALIEVRLSPQINVWVYGFFQHSFEQMMRDGGFRPIVFLPHGLWAAFFFMTAAVSAAALMRSETGEAMRKFMLATGYLVVIVILCKSLASLMYTMALIPLLVFASPKIQVRVTIIFAIIAVLYPILRELGLIPLDWILAQAEAISAERAQSLGFRFDNEEQLLQRAHERRLLGWGGWGRNLMRDPDTGVITTIPDGEWIIIFGTFGWVGYVAQMGLLSLPLVLLWRQSRLWNDRNTPHHVTALAVILSITLIDMLLNAILTPYTWLTAGAILGHCEGERVARQRAKRPEGGRRAVIGAEDMPDQRSVI